MVLFVWFVSHQGRELAEASRRIEQPQLEAHCEGVANGSVDVIHRAVTALHTFQEVVVVGHSCTCIQKKMQEQTGGA